MDYVKSEIAIYRKASGRLVQLAPTNLTPTEPAFDWVALPDGYGPTTHTWDPAGRQMVEDLAKLRALRWAEMKAARDAAQLDGCSTPLGRVDTTVDSQVKIAGSVQMAMLAQMAEQPFTVDWTMQDNSVVTHDAVAMIAMGLAVGQHIRACHEQGVALRASIEAASEPAAIAAVTWSQDPQPSSPTPGASETA